MQKSIDNNHILNWKHVGFLLKLLFSIAILGFLLLRIDLHGLLLVISELKLEYLVISIIFYFIAQIINSIRWKLFLQDIKLTRLIKFTLISQFYALFLPGQFASEGVKALLAIKGEKNKSIILSSVMIDKLTGLIGLLLATSIGFFFSNNIRNIRIVIAILAWILLFSIFLFSLRIPGVKNFITNKIKGKWKISNQIIFVVDTWQKWTKEFFLIIKAIALGVIFHIVAILIPFVFSISYSLPMTYFDWMVVFGLMSIIVLLPVSLGGVGIREASLISFLSVYEVSSEYALVISLGIYMTQICGGIIGLACDLSDKMQLKTEEE